MSTQDGMRADWANKDFYKELGVAKDATEAEIKKAYRKLARANHPDSNPGDTAKHDKFKAVAEAYDVLGDADKRAKYDEMRSLFGGGALPDRRWRWRRLRHQRPAPRPRRAGGGGGFGDMFGDLFGGFGRTRAKPRPTRGGDVETTATIGFTDAMDGVTISLRLTSDSACPECKGSGGKPGTKPHVCPECEGAGFIVQSMGGAFSINETCPACGGRQLVYDESCPTCHGSGRGLSARTIQARIPAGVKDGQKIRLRGKGAAGENGGPPGDLFVTVKVTAAPAVRPQGGQPHPRRPHLLRRGGPRRRDQDPDPRRRAGDPQDPAPAPPTAAPSASAARAPSARTAPAATCSPPSRSRCPPCSTRPPARRSRPTARPPPASRCVPSSSRGRR